MPTATLVLTTIFDPVILEDYRANFTRYGHIDDVKVIVIPDRKTPISTYETCAALARQGFDVKCPGMDEQEAYLKRIGLDPAIIPYNSDNRRNVGFLMAIENRTDFLISIDDDNFCMEGEDYFAAHANAFWGNQRQKVAGSGTRFLNICDLLEINVSPVYARGFPYFARHKSSDIDVTEGQARVMINAGLWLRHPDVDAMTWLSQKPSVSSFKGSSLVLHERTWSPVNSQNTALVAHLIPSYYFIRMGYPAGGTTVDRYGDIFSGYFALACAKQLGGTARFGTPVADHRRNNHNYMRDISTELPAIMLLEDLLAWMVDARLSGSTCMEAYTSLSYAMEDAVEKFKGLAWTDALRGFFHQMGHFMRAWVTACRTLAGGDGKQTEERMPYENFGGDDRLFGDGTAYRVGEADPAAVARMAARNSGGGASRIEPGVPLAV